MSVESVGARVRSVVDYIITADVPIQSLGALIRLPNVVYVQAARQMRTSMLDVSVPGTKANQVWESAPGFTGKGIIVGVIDSGIDWSHPDFMGADGKSRILYIWDQTMPMSQKHPAGYSYGIEWTKAQIDAGQCLEMDTVGHGTHVSSIIAGDGRGRHQFTGMAPDANIILVKSHLANADIIDAVNYILTKAAALNRPVVINMSFGSQTGPHDGTEFLDQALDTLLLSGSYTLTVIGTDTNGNVGRCSKTIQVQKTDYSLLQNYPNPFNPGTWIPYELRQPEKVTIEIYNAAGQLIRTLNLGIQTAGSHISKENAAYWDGKDDDAQKVASGLYFYVLRAGQYTSVRKMVLAE